MAEPLKDPRAAPVGAASANEAVATPAPSPAPSYGWTLGRLAVVLVSVEALTGLALMFHYRPTLATAYLDLVDLAEVSAFAFLRPLHRWTAHAVVIVVWLHLLKAVLDGSYKPPRQRNWAVGVGLLVVTLMWATSGFLLPWDENAYWTIAATAPAMEPAPDGGTLLRYYVLHCAVLPFVAAALLVYHLWRARRDAAAG